MGRVFFFNLRNFAEGNIRDLDWKKWRKNLGVTWPIQRVALAMAWVLLVVGGG